MSFAVSFGVAGISSVLECLNMGNFVATLLAHIAVPIIAVIVIFLAVAMRLRLQGMLTNDRLLEISAPIILKVLFIAYPLVTNVAFDAFSCYEFTGSGFLKADVSIQCHTPEHEFVKALAWFALLLYPFGLLVITGGLLLAARKAILSGRPTALSRATAFLHQEYEPRFFWWELLEMLRKLVLVGIMVLFQGNMMQIVVGCFLSVMFLLFQVQANPFIQMADDFLATSTSFGLVICFLACYAYKDAELINLPDIQDKMSKEQVGRYVMGQVTLLFIMVVGILGVLLVSFCLFVVQSVAAEYNNIKPGTLQPRALGDLRVRLAGSLLKASGCAARPLQTGHAGCAIATMMQSSARRPSCQRDTTSSSLMCGALGRTKCASCDSGYSR